MLGFIFRCYIQHPNDEENRLIYLQLSQRYEDAGIFKAGQSYMIRSKTKNECISMIYEIMRFDKISVPKFNDVGPWCPSSGYYTVRQQKEMYIVALLRYLSSLTQVDETFRYITDADKKLSYLDDKLRQLKPRYEEKLFKCALKYAPFYREVEPSKYCKYHWIVYSAPSI